MALALDTRTTGSTPKARLPWFAGIRPQTLSRYFAPLWSPPAAVDTRQESDTR